MRTTPKPGPSAALGARLLGVILVIGATCAVAPTGAQAPADARFDALAALAEAKMKEYGVPGVALGIADGAW